MLSATGFTAAMNTYWYNGIFAESLCLQTWYNVPDYIRDANFVVKNLQAGHSYVFIVRAENEHGISVPSPASNLVRTRGVKNAGSF
jgi:hypothetical protein